MLISYLLSQTLTSTLADTLKISKRLTQGESKHREEKSQGAAKSKDEKHSKDEEERISLHCLTKSPTWLQRKKGMFRFHLSVYHMSRKGEHIKCMTHKCVCLSATPTPCREGCIQCCRRDKKRQFRALLGVVIQLGTQNMWLSGCMPICLCS